MGAYAEIAATLESILTSEFAADGFDIRHDRVHESLGHEGAVIGISIDSQGPTPDDYYVMDTAAIVQVYDRYTLDVDPNQRVDPRNIAAKGERFMNAVRQYNVNSTGNLWYFNVVGIEYPNDPTGNKTRFEAAIIAKSNNPALTETGL